MYYYLIGTSSLQCAASMLTIGTRKFLTSRIRYPHKDQDVSINLIASVICTQQLRSQNYPQGARYELLHPMCFKSCLSSVRKFIKQHVSYQICFLMLHLIDWGASMGTEGNVARQQDCISPAWGLSVLSRWEVYKTCTAQVQTVYTRGPVYAFISYMLYGPLSALFLTLNVLIKGSNAYDFNNTSSHPSVFQ